jgi:putative oxidoreductase
MKILQLNFIPRSADLALLVLRVWLGATLLLNHGLAKLTGFGDMMGKFPDPLHVGTTVSLTLAVFAEVLCAALLALGVFTRFAALVLVIFFGVAFFITHGHALSGAHSGELPFVYLAGFATVFVAGGGSYALERNMGGSAK